VSPPTLVGRRFSPPFQDGGQNRHSTTKEPKEEDGLSGKQGFRPDGRAVAAVYDRRTGQRRALRTRQDLRVPILARYLGPPYRWQAWVNNSADAPSENVAELISSAKEPSKSRCGASPPASNQRNPPHRRSRRNNVSCSVCALAI
jgi:hypothetical protein